MMKSKGQGGFTYLLALIALAAIAVTLMQSTDDLSMRRHAQQEAELLFRGEQIRQAIAAWREHGNGCFPLRFEQLLVDRRGVTPRYLLRQHYPDPLTQQKEWGMIYDAQGRWLGVYSQGKGSPRQKRGFTPDQRAFAKATSYAGWQFQVATDPQAPLPRQCER